MSIDSQGSRGPFLLTLGEGQFRSRQSPAYFCVFMLVALILGIIAYKAHDIPETIANEVHQHLKQAPRLASLAKVRGRDLVLEGEINPFPGMDKTISRLSSIYGLRRLHDRLVRVGLDPPHVELQRVDESILVTGTLNKQDADWVIAQIQGVFPNLFVHNLLQTKESVGSPAWLEGLTNSLGTLVSVADLELAGWRDRLQLNGTVPDNRSSTLVRTMAAYFVHPVEIDNRIVEQTAADYPVLSLTANQAGLELDAVLMSAAAAAHIQHATERVFGFVNSTIILDPAREHDEALTNVLSLLPDLAAVENLRLMSTGKGYALWGQVPDARQLKKIVRRIGELGLVHRISNNIGVRKNNSPARIILLRYHQQLTLSGRLPSLFVRKHLLDSTKEIFGVERALITLDIQPQVHYSSWIDVWPEIIRSIPLDVFGIAVNGSQIFLTGMPETEAQKTDIELQIGALLSDYQIHNWMTVTDL